MEPSTTQTLYFGYGSNLWQEQMALRCPGSQFVGIGRLANYRWMINSRGYANVAACTRGTEEEEEEEVWGLIYTLTSEDEDRLDINEGVPWAYEKRMVRGEFWEVEDSEAEEKMGKEKEKKTVEMLVYIDFLRADGEGNQPRSEYVHRMNMGIADALRLGVPMGYVDSVLRRWIPEENLDDDVDEEGGKGVRVRELARRQAASFQDESGVARTGSGLGL